MTYIIAEAGLSHMGKMEYAEQLIHDAVDAECDCVKFQVYKTDELIDKVRGPERYAEFKERELSYDQFVQLHDICEWHGIDFLATPHTVGAFHFLEELRVTQYKVGSGDRGEILDLTMKTGKPLYISTGMRDWEQIKELMKIDKSRVIDYTNNFNITILHCITMYPVTDETTNLGFIKTLKRWFPEVGYSDHYPGTYACELAVAMGASVIEKHIRLPESEGQDNSCALGFDELKELVRKVRKIEVMIGSEMREYSEAERENESWALKGPDGKRPYSS